MTDKIARKFPKALAAIAVAASFVSASSLAGEFTVEQGKRYRATLALKSVERLADNDLIARKFRALGFTLRARFGFGRDPEGRRRLARQGCQRSPAPSDRSRRENVSCLPADAHPRPAPHAPKNYRRLPGISPYKMTSNKLCTRAPFGEVRQHSSHKPDWPAKTDR